MKRIKISELNEYKKLNSLIDLEFMGLNTPEFIVIQSIDDLKDSRNIFLLWGLVGIRTDLPSKAYLLPVYFDQTPEQAFTRCEEILNNEKPYIIIASKAIKLNDAILQGKLIKSDRSEIECFLGAGNIRDKIENGDGRDLIGFYIDEKLPREIKEHQNLITQLLNYCRNIKDSVIEFSFYPYPVGKKKQGIVFWEVIKIKHC